jgi:hypothetical protein
MGRDPSFDIDHRVVILYSYKIDKINIQRGENSFDNGKTPSGLACRKMGHFLGPA